MLQQVNSILRHTRSIGSFTTRRLKTRNATFTLLHWHTSQHSNVRSSSHTTAKARATQRYSVNAWIPANITPCVSYAISLRHRARVLLIIAAALISGSFAAIIQNKLWIRVSLGRWAVR